MFLRSPFTLIACWCLLRGSAGPAIPPEIPGNSISSTILQWCFRGNWKRPPVRGLPPWAVWWVKRAEFLSVSMGDCFKSWSTRCDYPLLSMEMLVLAIKLFSPFIKEIGILFDSVAPVAVNGTGQGMLCEQNVPFVSSLLSVVRVLLLLCLGQGGEEALPSHPCMALSRNIP